MDIPGSRFYLSKNGDTVTAVSQNGESFLGGLLETDIPFTEISFPELISRERKKIIELKKKSISFIITDACKSLKQARAVAFACVKEELPLILCMACDEDGETPYEDYVLPSLISLQELGVAAFGITGSLTPKQSVTILESLVPFAKIPLLVAPTAGEANPILPDLYDLAPKKMAEEILPVLEQGVTLLMENSGVTQEHAVCLKKALFSYDPSNLHLEHEDEEENIILSNNRDFFVISDERLEFTDPIPCAPDMADNLLQAEEESFDVLQIAVNTPDDALLFSENAHLAGLPIMFLSDDILSLRAALLTYDGRAMVNRECGIEEEELNETAEKYGCVLY